MAIKKILISSSAILALVEAHSNNDDMAESVLAIAKEALEANCVESGAVVESVRHVGEDAGQGAPVAAPALALSADKLAEFLVSDPRFTARSFKAIRDHFAVTDADINATLSGANGRFNTYNSRRGLGVLVEEND